MAVLDGWAGPSHAGAARARLQLGSLPCGPPATRQYLALNRARTCIDVFDYADASTQWVTDHQIAQQLATTINSLADQSKAAGGPGKVIVVAHSMGGLATRCASAASCSGVTGAAAHIAALITFGTPTLGSFLKGYGASEAEHLVADILSTDCYATGNVLGTLAGVCSQVRALGTSAAGAAFTPGSAQQKALNRDHDVLSRCLHWLARSRSRRLSSATTGSPFRRCRATWDCQRGFSAGRQSPSWRTRRSRGVDCGSYRT